MRIRPPGRMALWAGGHALCALLCALAAICLLPAASYAVQATLTWTDGATGEDGYRIERRDGPDTAPWVSQDTVGTGVTTFNQTGLVLGTRYCYRSVAFNGFGDTTAAPPEGCGTPDLPQGGSENLTIILAR